MHEWCQPPWSSIAGMQEFSSVTASSYDADALAPLLNEKSAEGWEVVSIVAAGTNIVAYLSRDAGAAGAADIAELSDEVDDGAIDAGETVVPLDEAADAPVDPTPIGTAVPEAAVAAVAAEAVAADEIISDPVEPELATSPVDEPAGWGTAPETSEASVDDLAAQISEPEPAADIPVEPAPVDTAAVEPAPEPEPEPVVEQAAAAAPESTVPAGWYADPSGRYELRYWDGTAWTEHVSRAGQQFTDPPVA